MSGSDVGNAQDAIAQVENLYQTYLVPSSHTYLELDHSEVAKIAAGQGAVASCRSGYSCQGSKYIGKVKVP